MKTVLDLLDKLDSSDGGYVQFSRGCKEARLKPIVAPFWDGLPYAHVYRSITPDVLHQLYQGVLKHMVAWLVEAYGAAEIDARCRRLPPNHNIHLFKKGISSLSRVTGQEHASICQFLLALVIDAVPIGQPQNASEIRHRLLRSLRGLLDFLYLAQYPIHSTTTLELMEDALARFHADKDVFIELGVRTHFNIPKLHFAVHYVNLIKLFGTTDNFNTEYTERLHIDLAKDAYAATNKKDEFPQMTRWLTRREKMSRHAEYVSWRLAGSPLLQTVTPIVPGLDLHRRMYMAKHPSKPAVYIEDIESQYGATHFRAALARYIISSNCPDISHASLESQIRHLRLPFRKIPVWHRIKWLQDDAYTGKTTTVDSVHACTPRKTSAGILPARFDTVLIDDGTGTESGLKGETDSA